MTEIGDKIREARKRRGLTAEQLSELSGVARTSITRIENGSYNPSARIVEKLVSAMGAEVKIE